MGQRLSPGCACDRDTTARGLRASYPLLPCRRRRRRIDTAAPDRGGLEARTLIRAAWLLVARESTSLARESFAALPGPWARRRICGRDSCSNFFDSVTQPARASIRRSKLGTVIMSLVLLLFGDALAGWTQAIAVATLV